MIWPSVCQQHHTATFIRRHNPTHHPLKLSLIHTKGGVGRDYLLAQLTIKGKGPYDFMVDSGLTAELITPHLQQALGIRGGGQRIAGLVRFWGGVR